MSVDHTIAANLEGAVLRLERVLHLRTGHMSNLHFKMQHPAYKALVALGDDIVPILVRHANDEQGRYKQGYDVHACLLALHDITGAEPVKEENRGRLVEMCRDWQEWLDKREHPKLPSLVNEEEPNA